MKNKNLIPAPELFGTTNRTWTGRDFKHAIKKFRQNAPTAPIPRLYDAYRWLKEQLDTKDAESDKQFTHFIEYFLRILEERGAGDSEIYSEIIRDSAEYKFLAGLFHNDDTVHETALLDKPKIQNIAVPVIKKTTLKDILNKKNIPLTNLEINTWHDLICVYLKDFDTEDSFVQNCLRVIKTINKRTEKEPYHVEIIIIYAFETLQKHKNLSLKTKDFAMQLLNLMTDRGETWSRLHKEYLEIIKK